MCTVPVIVGCKCPLINGHCYTRNTNKFVLKILLKRYSTHIWCQPPPSPTPPALFYTSGKKTFIYLFLSVLPPLGVLCSVSSCLCLRRSLPAPGTSSLLPWKGVTVVSTNAQLPPSSSPELDSQRQQASL